MILFRVALLNGLAVFITQVYFKLLLHFEEALEYVFLSKNDIVWGMFAENKSCV
jgi:hypothetical protein